MRATDVYAFIGESFDDLVSKNRNDGRAFYFREIVEGQKSTRIVRVSETTEGAVREIKLSVSSLPPSPTGKFSALPINLTALQAEIAEEIRLLKGKLGIA